MKKNKNLLILISTCIVMFLAILIYKKITPFGDNSFLDIDFFHQYFPMSGGMYDRVWNLESFIYSFNFGIGIPIFRNFFNYLSSPFNLLLLLFKRTSMLSVYSIIICLKGVVSSICIYLLLKKKLGDKFILVPISLMYAFSSYYIAYHWNIMWMDGISFLPLVVLGIESLVDNNKSLLYIFSLALVIYCNYYIGFIICIFCVLYFIMYLFTSDKYNKKQLVNKTIRFILSSICVGLLCSFFLIPLVFSMKSISATESINIPSSLYYKFGAGEFLFNHFSFIKSTVIHSDISNTPNISCGILSLLLIIPFIFNKKISIRVKIGYLSLLVILGISFFIPALDYFWHICHVPNDLPYRFSFLYSFILIIISAYSITNIKYVNKWFVFLSGFIVLISIVYLNITGYHYIKTIYIISNYVLVVLYLLYYLIYVLSKKELLPVIFTTVTVIISILITININWNMDAKVDDYYSDYNDKKSVINKIYKKDKGIYRIGEEEIFTYDDSVWYGFRGLNSFSSMEYENVAILMNKLGYPGNEINSYYYRKGNKIGEILFNIKYAFYRDYNDNKIKYYELPYDSGLMFKVNKEIYDWKLLGNNPFEIQSDFINKSYKVSGVYKKLEPIQTETLYNENNEIITKYTYESKNFDYYVYSSNFDLFDGMIIGNNLYYKGDYELNSEVFEEDSYTRNEYNEFYIINGEKEGDYFDIYVLSRNEEIAPYVYEIDESKLELFDNNIVKNIVKIDSFNEHSITGTIKADDSGVIYTSIPYDRGWNVYIDGKKVKTNVIGNALLGFDIEEGVHSIKLEYHIPYSYLGIIISLSSFIIIIYLERKKVL